MSRPCARPECGGEQHTDLWGTPVQCPRAEPVVQADTGRRCPRCDCPDGHEQCQHCKTCPHARTDEAAEFAASVGCAVLHRDAQGHVIPCPDADGSRTAPSGDELAQEKENFQRLAMRLDEWVGRAEDAEAAVKRVRDFCSPEKNTSSFGYLRRSADVLALLDQEETQ